MSEESLPRQGSIVYNIHHGDQAAKSTTLKRWKFINKYLIVPLARLRLLPLLGLKNTFTVIKVVGRKSGKNRYAGLQIRKIENNLFIFLARGKRTQWYKNHQENPDKTQIYYGFRKQNCNLRQLEMPEKLNVMQQYVKEHPKWAKIGIGWEEDDQIDDGLLADYIKKIEIVEILLQNH